MIRIALMSDLHLEFEASPGVDWTPTAGVDLVVLPGDVDVGVRAVGYAERVARELGCPVVLIPGNHEYYGHDRPALLAALREAAATAAGVLVLDEDEALVETAAGWVRLLGCTLWTDYALFGAERRAEAMSAARWRLTDHSEDGIRDGAKPLLPARATELHATAVAWLAGRLGEPYAGPTIVVTHHAPSPRSLPPGRRRNLVSAAYASDLERLVIASGPDLWLHGHIHYPSDYLVGRTRVVCHPRGYPGEEPGARRRPPRILDLPGGGLRDAVPGRQR